MHATIPGPPLIAAHRQRKGGRAKLPIPGDPMWPLFTAMAFAPVIGLLAWWVSTRDRLDPEALAKVAAGRGWSCTPGRGGDEEWVDLAPADRSWILRVSRRVPHGSSRTHTSTSDGLGTSWTASAICPRGILAIRPGNRPSRPLAPPPAMLAPLFARAVEEMTGGRVEDAGPLDALAPVDTNDAGFDGRFVAVANEPAFASYLAEEPARAAVAAACETGAAVVLSPAGIRLGISGKALADGVKIDALVAAGERLAALWARP